MTDRLKIGQEVLIHGYVDEIRKDTVIIRNDGGYFGTVEYEITDIETPNTNEVLNKIRAKIKALSNANPSYWHSGDMVEREEVFEIIDKYTAESEG